MVLKEILSGLLFRIDGKREFTEYSMTELQKISEKSIELIESKNPESESLIGLKLALELSDQYHKSNKNTDITNIMEVLRLVKYGIEQFLETEY